MEKGRKSWTTGSWEPLLLKQRNCMQNLTSTQAWPQIQNFSSFLHTFEAVWCSLHALQPYDDTCVVVPGCWIIVYLCMFYEAMIQDNIYLFICCWHMVLHCDWSGKHWCFSMIIFEHFVQLTNNFCYGKFLLKRYTFRNRYMLRIADSNWL